MSKKHETHHKRESHKVVHEAIEEQEAQEQQSQKKNVSWKRIVFSEKALIVLLIIIAIGISTFFRMYPSSLHVTDTWAEQTINSQIKSNIQQQVAQQFPNLPQAQRDAYVNTQLQEVLAAQKDSLLPQQEQLATQFKSQLQDKYGNTYLLAIDPYVWLTYAENYVANGHRGEALDENGKSLTILRGGRNEKIIGFDLHPYLTSQFYKIGKLFTTNDSFTVQRVAFLMPVFIIAFAIIAAFFLGRKISGNAGGFVAGLIVALNGSLLGRTPAGFSDTDAYLILFPLLISWLYLEAFTSKTWNRRGVFLGLSAIASVLFLLAWPKWWHIATILMGMTGIYFLFTVYQERAQLKKQSKNIKKLFTTTRSGRIVLSVFAFFALLLIFTSIGNAAVGQARPFFKPLDQIFIQPLSVLGVKNVATTDVWPNVLTTVAELNEGSWSQIIGSVGGKLFFIIGILGVLLTFFLKTEDDTFEIRYASLLVLWFFGLSLVGVMSARFIALLAAPFAIAFGVFFGLLWTKGAELLKNTKELNVPLIVTRIGLALIIVLLMITPIKAAHNISLSEVPSMDDGWHDSLISIKENSTDGIITSWWDFGHWFVNIADRRVTFDGGDQGRRIYWVGKSLMTPDVDENKAILRMLNCGQNNGYELLAEELASNYKAAKLIETLPMQTRAEAQTTLENAGLTEDAIINVLAETHCDDSELFDQYYIVSEDMVGKASVWAHFGGWDFDKAYAYNLAKNNEFEEAIQKMQDYISLTEDEANKLYFDATSLQNNREVDSWVSPWPSYVTSTSRGCTENNGTLTCTLNQNIGQQQGQTIRIDKAIIPLNNPAATQLTLVVIANGVAQQADAIRPQAVHLPTNEEFVTTTIADATFPYELTVGVTADGSYRAIVAESALAQSAFTKLFFFDGLYMDGYEKLSDTTTFRGQRIIVYKVDLQNEK